MAGGVGGSAVGTPVAVVSVVVVVAVVVVVVGVGAVVGSQLTAVVVDSVADLGVVLSVSRLTDLTLVLLTVVVGAADVTATAVEGVTVAVVVILGSGLKTQGQRCFVYKSGEDDSTALS